MKEELVNTVAAAIILIFTAALKIIECHNVLIKEAVKLILIYTATVSILLIATPTV